MITAFYLNIFKVYLILVMNYYGAQNIKWFPIRLSYIDQHLDVSTVHYLFDMTTCCFKGNCKFFNQLEYRNLKKTITGSRVWPPPKDLLGWYIIYSLLWIGINLQNNCYKHSLILYLFKDDLQKSNKAAFEVKRGYPPRSYETDLRGQIKLLPRLFEAALRVRLQLTFQVK